MADFSSERSGSIIETSLTELAFIFFFILLTVSAWKINTAAEELESAEDIKNSLKDQVVELQESLTTASEYMEVSKDFDPEELFLELTAGKKAAEKLEQVLQENNQLEKQLETVLSVYDGKKGADEIAKALEQHKEIIGALGEHGKGQSENPAEAVKELVQQHDDFRGQNINLRSKLANVGNGLDHPPCWADPQTGSIQYVFNVVINENSVEFHPGWPKSRATQALRNPNITSVPGKYTKNPDLWSRTQKLYAESVKKECRHFVRIYDHAESKKAFKQYLLGVENHFYKFLSSRAYI